MLRGFSPRCLGLNRFPLFACGTVKPFNAFVVLFSAVSAFFSRFLFFCFYSAPVRLRSFSLFLCLVWKCIALHFGEASALFPCYIFILSLLFFEFPRPTTHLHDAVSDQRLSTYVKLCKGGWSLLSFQSSRANDLFSFWLSRCGRDSGLPNLAPVEVRGKKKRRLRA